MGERPKLKLNYDTVIDGQTVRVQRLPARGKAKFKNPMSSEESPFSRFYGSGGSQHKSL